MGVRGDWERELAAAERDHALLQRAIAASTAYTEDRVLLEQEARWHDEAAELHERLAALYDRQEHARSRGDDIDLRDTVDLRDRPSSSIEEHNSTV